MGGGVSLAIKDRPDLKGHRMHLSNVIKSNLAGDPVNWNLTKKKWEGVSADPWGVTTKLDFSLESGFLATRKLKVSMGMLELLFTEKLVFLSLSGNKFATGNVQCLKLCEHLMTVNLGKCGVHGDLRVFGKMPSLISLDLAHSKVVGAVGVLAACSGLEELNLRHTKVGGDLGEIKDLPLTRLDLASTQVKGHLSVFEEMSQMVDLRIGATKIKGDVEAFWEWTQVTALDLSNLDGVEGDLGSFENCAALELLVLTCTGVDVDSLGKVRGKLKGCNIQVSNNTKMDGALTGP